MADTVLHIHLNNGGNQMTIAEEKAVMKEMRQYQQLEMFFCQILRRYLEKLHGWGRESVYDLEPNINELKVWVEGPDNTRFSSSMNLRIGDAIDCIIETYRIMDQRALLSWNPILRDKYIDSMLLIIEKVFEPRDLAEIMLCESIMERSHNKDNVGLIISELHGKGMYSTIEQIFLYLDDNTLGEIESCSDTLKLVLAGGKFWQKRLNEKALLSQKWKEKLATVEQIRPDLLYEGNGWRAAYHLIVKQLKDEATANPTKEESVKLLKKMFEICKRRNAVKLYGAVLTDEEDIPSWPPESAPRFQEVLRSYKAESTVF